MLDSVTPNKLDLFQKRPTAECGLRNIFGVGGRAGIFHHFRSKFKFVSSTTRTDTQANTHTLLTDNES